MMAEKGTTEAGGSAEAAIGFAPTSQVLDAKGLPLSIRAAQVQPGQRYWRIRKAVALTPEESHGIHNVYARCFRGGQRATGVAMRQVWPEGVAPGVTEDKPLSEWGDWNAPLYGDWIVEQGPGPYSVEVADGMPSEALVGMGLPRKQHYSYIVEFEEALAVGESEAGGGTGGAPGGGTTGGGTTQPTSGLRESLLGEAQRRQVLKLNPQAALQSVMLRDGFIPTSEEFPLSHAGQSYVAQRAERLSDGAVRVYYCLHGQWGQVYYQER
jgi:hypothetical protein